MNATRRLAIAAGLGLLAADVFGPLFFVFTGGLGTGQAYLAAVPDHTVQLGLAALCVFAMGAAGMVVVAALYPVLRPHNEALAIGSVLFRGVAESLAFVQAAFTLATVSVGVALAGTATSGQPVITDVLLLVRDQLALVALTSFGIAALMYCWVLLRAGLLPRWLAGWGVIGAAIWLAGVVWAYVVQGSDGGFAMAPLALNEVVMGIWLIAKGFTDRTTTATATSSLELAAA